MQTGKELIEKYMSEHNCNDLNIAEILFSKSNIIDFADWVIKKQEVKAVDKLKPCLHEWNVDGRHNIHRCVKCSKFNC